MGKIYNYFKWIFVLLYFILWYIIIYYSKYEYARIN